MPESREEQLKARLRRPLEDDRPRAGGRPVGYPKTGGRQKGTKNYTSLSTLLSKKTAELTATMTPEEIKALKPKEVLRLVCLAAVETSDWFSMLTAAQAWAPYEHAKLSISKSEFIGTLTLEQLVIAAHVKMRERDETDGGGPDHLVGRASGPNGQGLIRN